MIQPDKSYFLSGTALRELRKATAALDAAMAAAMELCPRDPLVKDLSEATVRARNARCRAELFYREAQESIASHYPEALEDPE